MAKGYWVAHVDVDEFDPYKDYIAADAARFAENEAGFLLRGGNRAEPEGKARTRTVAFGFPSYKKALACCDSPGYQAAKALSDPVSTGDLVIIHGYEG